MRDETESISSYEDGDTSEGGAHASIAVDVFPAGELGAVVSARF